VGGQYTGAGSGVPAAHLAVSPEKMIVLTAGMELVVHRWLPNTPDGTSLPFTFVPAREAGHVLGFLRSLASGGRKKGGAWGSGGDSGAGPVEIPVLLEPRLAATLKEVRKHASTSSSSSSSAVAGTATAAAAAAAAAAARSGSGSSTSASGSGGGMRRLPCEVTPDGQLLIVGGNADGAVKIFYVDRGGAPACSAKAAHRGTVSALALSSDGRVLVTASTDSSLAVWTLSSPGGGSGGGGGGGGGGSVSSSKGGERGGTAGTGDGSSGVRSPQYSAAGVNRGSAPEAYFAGEQSTVASALAAGLAGGAAGSAVRQGDGAMDDGACIREAHARAGIPGGGAFASPAPSPFPSPSSPLSPPLSGGGGSGGGGVGGSAGEGVPVHTGALLRGPHFMLKGHREGVAAVAVSTDLGVAVATSARAGSSFHCLITGRFLRVAP